MASQKSDFFKRTKKIIDDHPGVFKALEDFETTGKISTKARLNFTIDKVIARKFRELCKKKKINMSNLIEQCINEKIKE